jgi:serine/threonine protein kinase
MIGKIIGKYRLIDELGYGNMGVVYRGQHIRDGSDVVIKEVSMTQLPTSTQVQLKAHFRRETFILSQLDHPGIAKIYESFSRGENHYLVLEYVQATSLRELLEREGVPSPAQALFLCKQALTALDYAHNFSYMTESDRRLTGIIHRDIKSSNLLIDGNGELKLTDFGIVKMPERQSMAPPSFRPGTTEYMPPEHLRGIDLDVRSDIYSLGVTFYEVLTGKLPVKKQRKESEYDDKEQEYYEAVPVPITELRPEIDPFLASIFMRAIQKAPGDRFQSAAEFLRAIEEYERNYAGLEEITSIEALPELEPGVSIIEIRESPETGYSYRAQNRPSAMIPAVPPVYERDSAVPAQASVSLKPWDKKSPGTRKLLFVIAILLIIFGIPVGAYYLTQPRSAAEVSGNDPGTSGGPTPLPATPEATATPTPAVIEASSGDLSKLERARDSESKGLFTQAEKRYEEYLRSSPNAADTAMASGELENMKQFVSYLRKARAASKRLNFAKARTNYSEALKLRPYSRVVRTELDKTQKRLSGEQGN